jgi:acyl-homoserine lactone acylase PvdQ
MIALLVALTGAAFSAAPAAARDYASIARDIVSAGQYGTFPPPADADQQARMYDALTPLFNHVTSADILKYFKPEPMDVASAPGPLEPETVPHPGVTITRDAYNVPYVRGVTDDDVTWATGWVTAEDHSLLLNQARYNARVSAIDAPGLKAFDLITSLKSFKPSAQTEREVAKQTGVLERAGAKGRAVLHDIDVYLQGINAYFAAHGGNSAPYTRNDIYALNALKGQFVGEGGGDEVNRAQFLASLSQRLGQRRGTVVYDELRNANVLDSPATLPGRARFEPPPRSTSGNVIPDAGSVFPKPPPSEASDPSGSRPDTSNILMFSGGRSSTHHPIMVAGPQIGYTYPGFTWEIDVQGPGISARGSTSAPFPGYVFIGRNPDSAWSLTSAGLDIIDTYVETLCGHSRHRYLFRGRCRPMQFFDAGSLDGKEITFYRTVHGPVTGYARVHGRLVALSRKRSSYGRDTLDLLLYRDLTTEHVHNAHQFLRAANQTPQTFNSFYVNDKDVAMFTSGLIPIRPRNVDPALPIDGRGQEEWRGYVSFKNHMQAINPRSGEVVNWNNRMQDGYWAPDDKWSLGTVHRVQLLLRDLGHSSTYTPAAITSAMNEAATQDVREVLIEPLLSRLMRTARAPNARAAQMLSLLDAWYRAGSSRLDRTGSGRITDPGAAIMDTAWPMLSDAWASSVLGPALRNQLASIQPRFDEPWSGPIQPNGREQTKGWFVYMDKDLRSILGLRVRDPYTIQFCGGGHLSRCRALLWSALDRAGRQLASQQGPNPQAWRSDANREKISYVPGLLPFKLRYTNRPSGLQQIISFSGHAPGDS